MRKRTLFSFCILALAIISCSNPMDKKISTSNYKDVIEEIEHRHLISKPACDSLKKGIVNMIIFKGMAGDNMVHIEYGCDYENITYQDVYNYLLRKRNN